MGSNGSMGSIHPICGLHCRRVRDAQLFEVRLVLGRVVVVLLHLRAVLLHPFLVQPDCRLILRTDERHVLRRLGLDVLEVVPRLRHQFGPRHQVDDGEGDDLGAVLHALVCDGVAIEIAFAQLCPGPAWMFDG